MAAFDKIEDPHKIGVVFEELSELNDEAEDDEELAEEESMPGNRVPIIISGPEAIGKSSVIARLLEEHKGVFASVVRHTTREPLEGKSTENRFISSRLWSSISCVTATDSLSMGQEVMSTTAPVVKCLTP